MHAISYYNFLDDLFQGPTEKEQIDVQGDIAYDIVEFITETWPDVIYSYHFLFICVVCFFGYSLTLLNDSNQFLTTHHQTGYNFD